MSTFVFRPSAWSISWPGSFDEQKPPSIAPKENPKSCVALPGRLLASANVAEPNLTEGINICHQPRQALAPCWMCPGGVSRPLTPYNARYLHAIFANTLGELSPDASCAKNQYFNGKMICFFGLGHHSAALFVFAD
jgi:hypothetical protein